MKVRSGVKGIVIRNNKLLTIKKYDQLFGTDYTLPGGGQEHGENLIDALKREFLEEVGCHIEVQNVGHGIAPDEDHLGIEWITISNLEDYRFFPVALIPYINKIAEGHIVESIYTGDIN